MGRVPQGSAGEDPSVNLGPSSAQIVVLRPSPARGATAALAVRTDTVRSALSSETGLAGTEGSGSFRKRPSLHRPGPPAQSCSQTALSLPSNLLIPGASSRPHPILLGPLGTRGPPLHVAQGAAARRVT